MGCNYFQKALAVCLALEAFAAGAASSQPETVVRFSYWANFEENTFFRIVCEDFERDNPGVKIKREWYVGDNARKQMLVFITNKAADIILMDDEPFPTYAVRGYLEDLRPYILRESDEIERGLAAELRYVETPQAERDPNFKREYLPTALESFNYKRFQGAIPWDGNIALMYYNKDLFDKEGIPYPSKNWTWDEMRALAKRFTKDFDGDGRIDQFGTTGDFGFLGFETVLWSFGGEILNPEQSKCLMNSPEAREAVQFEYDMMMKDHSIAWTGELEGFLTEVQLLTGRVAMVPAMSYMLGTLNRVPDAMRWDVAPIPIGPRGGRNARITWDGISINVHTSQEKKEIAWKFIKCVLNDKHQHLLGKRQRGLPVRRADALTSYIRDDTPASEEIALESTEFAKLTPVTARYMEIRDAANAEFERLAFASKTGAKPNDVLAAIAAKVDLVLKKEMEDWAERESGISTRRHSGSGLKALGLAAAILAVAFGAVMLVRPIRRHFLSELVLARHMVRSRWARWEAIEGLLFASPWLIGFCLFTLFPIVFSIVLSFCQWDPYEPINTMKFIGLDNFARAMSRDEINGDPLVLKALWNTLVFAVFVVPLSLCTSLGLAILLNQKVPGISLFRTAFYLPSIVSGVATVVLWTYIFNPNFGPINVAIHGLNGFLDSTRVLAFITLPEPKWLGDPAWSKPAMILMSLWGAGGAGMLIFLAGLQGVPDTLYEVAELDGAGRLRKFWSITLPMLTPTLYFNLIMGLIGAMKVFMQAYIMTNGTGGVDKSLLFYVLHLFNKAFVEYEMGYASALAWILFVIILSLTMLVIKSSAIWVYYEGDKGS